MKSGNVRIGISFTILALLLFSTTGCLSKWKFSNMLDLDKGMPWEGDEDEPREGTPVRVVSSWVDTVKHTQGEMPQRGFGGRLLFYDDEDNDPIQVEGELVVYAFDEANRDPIDNRPTRRFVFPAEQVAQQMSKATIGPSYSFFLPWDHVGGPQADISLICRFKPASGAIVVSEQTRHLLPGVIQPDATDTLPQNRAQAKTEQPMYKQLVYESGGGSKDQAEQASYNASTDGGKSKLMTTTSISLPRNYRLPGDTDRSQEHRNQGYMNYSRPPHPHDYPPYRALPSFDGPSATNSSSYQQAAAFSARFSGSPINPAVVNALGPEMLSPFGAQLKARSSNAASVAQNVAFTSDILAPPAHNASYATAYHEGLAVTSPVAAQGNTTQVSMPTPAIAQSLQPNAAAAAAIPPAYLPPQAQQQLAAQPGAGTTTVSYLSPAESLQWERGQRSFGSQPSSPQAPSLPAVR